jgi:dTDP-4-amino-4,6-dideoxygalactose transaminase
MGDGGVRAIGGEGIASRFLIMKVPLIKPDLPTLEEIRGPIEEILANGRITNFGRYVTEFERAAGEYLGVQAVTVSSGTMGLLFTLSALGLERGQKVIFPSFTFMATAQAVRYAGGVPVFAEVGDDLNLCPRDLEELLETHDNVGAVIAVHMYGLPAKAREIEEIVRRASEKRGRKIALMFDAAHAFGASAEGVRVGGFGDVEVFSLSVTKVLVTVEGGLVATHDAEVAERIRRMRNYGIQANYNAYYPGMNGKMSEFHAIVGLHNLSRIERLMEERQNRARRYRELIESRTKFQVVPLPRNVEHTFKDFTIFVDGDPKGERRDRVIRYLGEQGVETRAYFYPPVHEQETFREYADRALPKTEALARRVVTLPFYTTITEEEMSYVAEALKKAGEAVQ